MAVRPSASGFSSTAGTAVTGISWSHTAVAGRAIYVTVQSNANISGATSFPAVTFGGIPLTVRAAAYHINFFAHASWTFVLPAALVVPGTDTIEFDNGAVSANYIGHAINVADAPSDASVILPGVWSQDSWPSDDFFTRSAYGWDPLGLQIASGYSFPLGAALVLSGGTTLGTGTSVAVQSAPCADDLIPFTLQSSHVGSHGLQLFSFMIPPHESAQPRTGGGFQPWVAYPSELSGSVGDFVDAGLPCGGTCTPGRAGSLMLTPGTAHSWVVTANMPVGDGNTVIAEIYRGGAPFGATIGALPIPTGITLTITGSSQVQIDREDLAALLSWARYERLLVRYTFADGTSLPSGLTLRSSLLVESGDAGAHLYGGGPLTTGDSVEDRAFYKAPLHPDAAAWRGTANSDKSLVGINVTQTEMVVERQTVAAVEDDCQFYMEKRAAATPLVAVLQDGSGGTVDTTAGYPAGTLGPSSIARSRFSLSWAPGDLMGHVGFLRAGGSSSRHAATIKVVPSTRGQVMVSGHSIRTSAAVNYAARPNLPSSPTDLLADEDLTTIVIPPMAASGGDFDVTGLRAYLELVGPDPGTWAVRLRQDLADTSMADLVMSGSPADPIAGVVGGEVAYPSLSELSLLFVVAASPTLQRQFWTMPGFLRSGSRGVIGPHLWLKFPRTQPDVAT